MGVILNIITKILPFLGPLLDKLGGKSEKAAELDAQRKLEEAAALREGRISPRYLLFYVLTILFAVFGFLFLAGLFFPNYVSLPEMDKIRELIHIGGQIGLE